MTSVINYIKSLKNTKQSIKMLKEVQNNPIQIHLYKSTNKYKLISKESEKESLKK